MKRTKLLRHLQMHGCLLLREGRKHTLVWNPTTKKIAAVPRHREIKNIIAETICKELGVIPPK